MVTNLPFWISDQMKEIEKVRACECMNAVEYLNAALWRMIWLSYVFIQKQSVRG